MCVQHCPGPRRMTHVILNSVASPIVFRGRAFCDQSQSLNRLHKSVPKCTCIQGEWNFVFSLRVAWKNNFFLLNRRQNQNLKYRYYVQLYPALSLQGSYYDSGKPTVFITHGAGATGNDSWIEDLKDAYLENVDANVFIVDWGQGASGQYLQVASNARIAAAEAIRYN